MRSTTKVDSGRPAPRYGPVGTVLVKTAVVRTQAAGIAYTLVIILAAFDSGTYEPVWAPTLNVRLTSRAVMRPSLSTPRWAVASASRPWKSVRKASVRSLVQRTGRPRRRAAQVTTTCSGYRAVRGPKPPPTSGQVTWTFSSGTLSAAASAARWRTTPWLPAIISYVAVLRSNVPSAA